LTGKTFELVPGDGEPRSEFVVVPGEKALLHEANALTLTLTAPESYGIEPGQPLILHGVKIGQVIERNLSSKGVSFTVAIEPQHRDLVQG
ncbi:MCE family protein, partial [Klebsiella pneumoniae]